MEQPREGMAYGSSRVFPGTAIGQATLSVPLKSPRVFSREWVTQRRPEYQAKLREGSDLVVISALHYQLDAKEVDALSRFRLAQFIKAGYYDQEIVDRYHIAVDPVMADMQASDFHAFAATSDGDIVCYMCLQSALDGIRVARRVTGGLSRHGAQMREHGRSIFPVESEYGSDLYGRHPAMGALPISNVREIAVLVRNMDVPRSVATDVGLVETIVASALYIIDPAAHVEAVVGSIAPEARRVLFNLGVPMMYAAYAQVVGENLSGFASGLPSLWTEASHDHRFWPFALASVDLRLEKSYYRALDDALAQADGETIWSKLRALRRERPTRLSRYLDVPENAGGVYWTHEVSHERIARTQG